MDIVAHHHGLRLIEESQKLCDKKRIMVAAGVAKVRSNIAFPVLVATILHMPVSLQAREIIGSLLAVPVPANPKEIAAVEARDHEYKGYFNPNELSQPYRDFWDNIR